MTAMWLHHLWNLLRRSWNGMVSATGTTTLGFVLWTLALTAVGWAASVAARWRELTLLSSGHPLNQALRDSLRAGEFLTMGVAGLVLISYSAFLIITVYKDHQLLVNERNVLTTKNTDLTKQLETRKHSMFTTDPVFVNTIYLLQAFNVFRHAQNGKPCVLLVSAPSESKESNGRASMVAQFSNSVSGCYTFGPMDTSVDPDVEKRAKDGMVPNKVVFHAARGKPAIEQLFVNLGNLMQLKRSYDIPSEAERARLYSIPNAGQEDVIWLQFGTDVKWNEQLD
jgi:hypothetical protein